MKKRIIVFFALILLFSSAYIAYASPSVVLNGQVLKFDIPPIIEDGRTLVPFRSIFEAFGADVQWNEETQTVTATKGITEIKLVIGGEAYKNGQALHLDVPAKIIDNRTLVPLRFISEALDYCINWDEKKIINITPPSDSKSRLNLGKKGDLSIVLTTPDLKTEIKNEKTNKTITLNSTSVQIMTNGDIIYMGKDYSLRKISPDGKNESILIPIERVNAPIYLNEKETLVAFTEARDFGEAQYPMTNGVAVYDIQSGKIETLLMRKRQSISNFGWIGDRLLIELPGENKNRFEPKLLDLQGNVHPFEIAPSLPLMRKWPKRSFCGKYLAYESYEDDVVVLNLETGTVQKFEKASNPQWTDQGLQFIENKSPKTVPIK